jgi:hypothetical protein
MYQRNLFCEHKENMTGFRIKQSTDDDYCRLGQRVIWYIVTDFSEDSTAHIFSVEDHNTNIQVKAASFSETTTIYRLQGAISKVIIMCDFILVFYV